MYTYFILETNYRIACEFSKVFQKIGEKYKQAGEPASQRSQPAQPASKRRQDSHPAQPISQTAQPDTAASEPASQQRQPSSKASLPARSASQHSQPAQIRSHPAQPASHQKSLAFFTRVRLAHAKAPDTDKAATPSKGKALDISDHSVPVASLISGTSGDVVLTKEMILKRLRITNLPDKVGLTNLDFLHHIGRQSHEDAKKD